MDIVASFNRWVHPHMLRHVCRGYCREMDKLRKLRPDLFRPVAPGLVRRHKELWAPLGLPVTDKWLRYLTNVSGIADFRYCPEDIFYAGIERVLNDYSRWDLGCEDKNLLPRYVPQRFLPRTPLRYMRGIFYDEACNPLSAAEVSRFLSTDNGPLVGKVCVESYGGHGVTLFRFAGGRYVSTRGQALTPEWIAAESNSYLLQEELEQCDFSARFNPSSANTCRMVTLRCPWDNRVVVLKTVLRIGVSAGLCDNMSQGGICACVDSEGRLSRYACNWKAARFAEHPETHVAFAGLTAPYYKEMAETACRLAATVPYMNLLSWDLLSTKRDGVKVLEINATTQSCDFLQYDFGGLFGEYSERVVDWCARHAGYAAFEYFRTTY
jgi:hypothetical protein